MSEIQCTAVSKLIIVMEILMIISTLQLMISIILTNVISLMISTVPLVISIILKYNIPSD